MFHFMLEKERGDISMASLPTWAPNAGGNFPQ